MLSGIIVLREYDSAPSDSALTDTYCMFATNAVLSNLIGRKILCAILHFSANSEEGYFLKMKQILA